MLIVEEDEPVAEAKIFGPFGETSIAGCLRNCGTDDAKRGSFMGRLVNALKRLEADMPRETAGRSDR